MSNEAESLGSERDRDESLELPPVDVIDYFLFVPFALYFVCILLFFEVAQRIAIRFGRLSHNRWVLKLNWALLSTLKAVGASVHVSGSPKLNPEKLYIIVSNHQSLFDVPSLHCLFGERFPRFIAKKELAGFIPSVSYNLNHGLNAVIDRSDREQAVEEIKQFGKRLREHRFVAVLFPEGTRSRSGKIRRFHSVGVLALLERVPEAELVPVTIDGSWKVQAHRRGPIPRGIQIRIHVGESLSPDKFASPKELVRAAEKTIDSNLKLLRQNPDAFGQTWRLG